MPRVSPLPSPRLPNWVRKVPVEVYFCTCSPPTGVLSATKTLPAASVATSMGPVFAHSVRKAPAEVNFWIRWLRLSAT